MKKQLKSDSLIIDMESLLIPISVLLSGIMISLSIIFTFKGNLINKNTDTTDTDTTNTFDETSNDGTGKTVSLDDDPYKGDKNTAKIAIVEFSDYECPYCKRHFTDVYPDIIKDYVDTGDAIYVFRDLPLSFHDPIATSEALAAQCIFDQGGNNAYFQYHDSIFENTNSNASNMTVDILKSIAKKQSGINYNSFVSCLDSKKFADEIKNDAQDAADVGISGTPGFLVGKISDDGKSITDAIFLAGAYPYENFAYTIESLLK